MQQASINVLRDQAIPLQKLLINNESIDAVEQKILEVISPIDGRVVTTVPREEVFRPVLAVSKFTDADQALSIANDSVYGVASAVWTSNLSLAHRMIRGIRSGLVPVNCYGGADITVPLGFN